MNPLDAILTAALIVAILWLLMNRPMAITGFYACIPFYKNALQPYILVDITILLAIGSCMVLLGMLYRHAVIVRAEVLLLWTALLCVVIVAIGYSPNDDAPKIGINYLLLTYLPLLPLLYIGKKEKYKRDFLQALLLVGGANLVLGLMALISGGIGQRLTLSTGSTIGVARATLLIPLILFSSRAKLSGRQALAFFSVSGVAFVVALAVGSRAPLLAAIFAMFIVLILDVQSWKKTLETAGLILIFSPLLALVMFLAWSRIPASSFDRFIRVFETVLGGSNSTLDNSSLARLDFARVAIEMFADRPVFGQGVGAFAAFSLRRTDMFGAEYPHNLFLHSMSELGVVGTIVVLVFIGYCLLSSIGGLTQSPLNLPILAIAITMFVNSMFSNSMYDFRIFWASLIAAACAAPGAWVMMSKFERERNSRSSSPLKSSENLFVR